MVDAEQCIEEFLKTEKVLVKNKRYGWHYEQVNRTRENMMVLTCNNGNCVAVIDTEEFNKLPKSRQSKIFKLFK